MSRRIFRQTDEVAFLKMKTRHEIYSDDQPGYYKKNIVNMGHDLTAPSKLSARTKEKPLLYR